jgi:hypothetical protein
LPHLLLVEGAHGLQLGLDPRHLLGVPEDWAVEEPDHALTG